MKKLETKMATMNEDKDKRIVELQAHNNDLFIYIYINNFWII